MRVRRIAGLVLIGVLPTALGCSKLLGEDFANSAANCLPGAGASCSAAGSAGTSGSGGVGGVVSASGMAGELDSSEAAGEGGVTLPTGSAGSVSASTGGESGAGAGGVAGAGGESSAGASGIGGNDGGTASAGGAPSFPAGCENSVVIIPECTLYATDPQHVSYPKVGMAAANGIGVSSTESDLGGFAIVASKRGSSTLAQTYTMDNTGSVWSSWFCFDALRDPLQIAGAALANGYQEFFATTRCGQLQHRVDTGVPAFWLPWQPLDLPSATSLITDVSISLTHDEGTALFVLDRGRLFWRRRGPDDGTGPYGPWRPIGDSSSLVAATGGLLSDSRLQVFAIDAGGHVSTAVQTTSDPDSGFQAWSDFDTGALPHALVDVEAPHSGPTPLEVYAVDSTGALWTRAENPGNGFTAWAAWSGPPPPTGIVELSGAGLRNAAGTPLQLAALTASGAVHSLRRTGQSWGNWRQF